MFLAKNLLIINLMFPILGIVYLFFIPFNKTKLLKIVALNVSCVSFSCSLILWGFFEKSVASFQFVTTFFWIPNLNLNFTVGIDGISLFFILLTTLLVPLCLLTSWNSVTVHLKEFLISFLFLNFLLIGTFCILDLLFFYIFFESILVPMFLIVGIWGSRERKVLAAYYFFIYTLLGSVLMLLSILYIYYQTGSTNYEILLTFNFSNWEQKFIWFAWFLAFSAKVPMLPLHLWLPEAHVEAPTSGSVILAGVLLKLGSYGFLRFTLPLLPTASFFFTPLVYTIGVTSIIYTSFTAIRQTDFKRIVAYTSIAHMNLVVIGIFSFNVLGLEGSILQSLSHGFVASALFLIIGIVYDRHRTRIVQYYGGLSSVMPMYSFIFLFFTMANISFPGTSSFIGEFLILIGLFKVNKTITFFAATGVVIGGAYSLWLLNKISFGNLKVQYTFKFLDLNLREIIIFLPLILGTLIVGIWPEIFLKSYSVTINNLIELIYF